MKRKFTFLIAAAVMLLTMVAQPITVWADSETITFSELGLENGVQYTDPFGTNISVTFAGGANDGKYYTTGSGIRTYGNGTITITALGNTVTAIATTFAGDSYAPAATSVWTCTGGSGTGTSGVNASWSGSATEIVMTRPSGSGHWRLQSITVTYTTGGGSDPSISADDVNIAYDATSGSIIYEIENYVAGTMTANTTADWISDFTYEQEDEIGEVGFTTSENESVSPRSATVTLTYTYGAKSTATRNVTVTQTGNPNASGGENNPYTVAEARAAIDAGTGITGVYATGIVSANDYYSSTNHYITYFISADGSTTSDQLEAFHGRNLNNTDFTSQDDIQVGDVVVIYGNLTKFNTTYEFAEGNYLISLVRQPSISINPETANQFTYVFGAGPSAEQVFEVTGTNLTSDDIVATITTGDNYFEVTNDEVYSNTVTVNSGDPISVRMKAGLAKGNYNGVLTLTNEGAENVVVNLIGTVTGATYTIESIASSGNITFAPASPVEDGTEVTMTAVPNAGYEFVAESWVFYNAQTLDIVVVPVTDGNKITMPACNLEVDATFNAKPTYAITCVYDEEQGLLTATPENAYEGQTVTLEYTAETGYTLSSIVITKTSDGSATGITPTASGDDFTFEMPGYAVTATATFVYNPNITYDFTDVNKFYTESTLENHPGTGSSNNIAEFYYKNGDSFTASGSSYYFSGTYFLLGKSGALVNLPTFTNYKITQIVIHSSSGHSTSVNVAIVSGDNTVAAGQTWSNKDKDYTYDIPAAYQNSALSVKVTNNYNTQFTSITLVRELKSTDPEISVSTDAINNFSYNEGSGPSKKSFTVSGSNLGTTPISIELETGTNFGLALTENAENWNSSVTIDPTEGSVNNATVYVRMNAGLSEGAYNDNISVTWGNLSESVALSGTVNPAPQEVTYTLITDINDLTPGYHYLIAGGTTGTVQIMDGQSSNNRSVIDATVDNGTITLSTENNYYDFVISGDATNNWTIYDESYNQGAGGYLHAASSSSNYLKTRADNNDGNSQWSISIANDGAATIVAQGSYSRKYMRFNNTLFSCYAENSSVTALPYLYKKTSDTPVYYSPTEVTVNNPNTSTDPITVQNNEILELTGIVTATDPANLVIEDGGQLVFNNDNVQATMKKSTAHAGAKAVGDWYTIASPLAANVATDGVTHLTTGISGYDLYRYDEESSMWENIKAHGDFTQLEVGRGYLYWNADGVDIEFAGKLRNEAVTYDLTANGTGTYKGMNLIGNPFSQDITVSNITGATLTGGYVLSKAGAWSAEITEFKPCQGFLVQVDAAKTIIISKSAAKSRANRNYIAFTVANSQYEDVTYAMFEEGLGLNKINHRNANIPMLYIAQNEENYAIATMSEETQSFNLNFKAMTTGQYTLSYKAEGNYDYLHVIDRLTGEDIDMLLDGEYSFIASPSDNDARFIVRLGYNANGNVENDIFAYQNGNDIIVNGEGELQVFDVTGRMVATQHVNGVQTVNVPSQGVFIFKLNEKTQKIVVR